MAKKVFDTTIGLPKQDKELDVSMFDSQPKSELDLSMFEEPKKKEDTLSTSEVQESESKGLDKVSGQPAYSDTEFITNFNNTLNEYKSVANNIRLTQPKPVGYNAVSDKLDINVMDILAQHEAAKPKKYKAKDYLGGSVNSLYKHFASGLREVGDIVDDVDRALGSVPGYLISKAQMNNPEAQYKARLHEMYVTEKDSEKKKAIGEEIGKVQGQSNPFYIAADSFNKASDDFLAMPENIAGNILDGVLAVAPLTMELMLTPEVKLGTMAQTIAGQVGGKAIKLPKLALLEGVRGYYSGSKVDGTTKDRLKSGFLGGVTGATYGTVLHGLGVGSSQLGKLVGDATKSSILSGGSAVLANGLGFGAYDTVSQLVDTGSVNWEQSLESTGVGIGLGIPGIAKAIGTDASTIKRTIAKKAYEKAFNRFVATSEQGVDMVQKMNIEPEKLREESNRLGEEAINATDDATKNRLLSAKKVVDGILDINAVNNDVVLNPDSYRKLIKDSSLSDGEKASMLDKIDRVVSTGKEIQESVDAKIDDARTNGVPFKDVELFLSEDTMKVFEDMDIKLPIVNDRLKSASDNLYEEYKRLETVKLSQTRMNTVAEINDMQGFLEKQITNLENKKNAQREKGMFINLQSRGKITNVEPPKPKSEPKVPSQEKTPTIEEKGEITLTDKTPISEDDKAILQLKGDNLFTRQINKDGERLGQITVEETENTWNVKDVVVDEENKGYGKEVYRQMNDMAQEEGKVIASGIPTKDTSKKATYMWDSLVELGEARKNNDGSYQMFPSNMVKIVNDLKDGKKTLWHNTDEGENIKRRGFYIPEKGKVEDIRGVYVGDESTMNLMYQLGAEFGEDFLEVEFKPKKPFIVDNYKGNVISEDVDFEKEFNGDAKKIEKYVKDKGYDSFININSSNGNIDEAIAFDPKILNIVGERKLGDKKTKKLPKKEEPIIEPKLTEETQDAIQEREPASPNVVETPQDSKEVVGERPEGERPSIPQEERVEGEAPKEEVAPKYNTVEAITEALSKGEINTQEHQRLTKDLHKRNFDLSKDRLRDALGGLANVKKAVGDESKNNFVEVYDALVDFIKNAINVYGDKIKSARDVAKYTGVEYNKAMQEAYDEATGKRVIGNDQKMRGFPKRVKEFQSFKDLKTDIETNPDLRYDPQVLSDIKDKIRTMSDEELVKAANPQGLDIISEGNDNMAVLAYLERIERTRAKGEDVMPIIEELSRKGTMWGQLIRQFAEVKGASAEGALTIFEKTLEKMNRYLTEEQRAKFIDLSNKDIDLRSQVREAQEKARILPTDENLKAYDKAKKEADDAYTKMAKYMQEVSPKNFWDMMGMALQGNLLTPMSQMTNIFANLMNVPITGSANTMASVMDRLHTMVTGSERTTTLDPRVALYGAKGFVAGTKEALRQIKTGVAVNSKAEIQRGFQPWRSMQQAFSGKDMAVTKEGKVAWQDRTNKFIEGLIGLPAESMFRLLNLGDKPFYRMAEAMTLFRIGKSKGLTGTDLENFVRFPSEKAQALAETAAKEATFQEDSRTSKAATAIANTIRNAVPSGAWRFLMRTQMPYIKTPANIISQTLDIAIPPLSMAKGVYEAYKGNKKESFVNFGKAGVGVMMGMAARYLLQHGLMSGSADDEKKIRNLQYDAFPPNSVNLSGLKRLIVGGDPSLQEGDEIINYTKMGLLGMALGVQANIYETGKELKASDTESKFDDATLRTLSALIEIPSYALEQSFLQGTSTLITAISDKQWDYWLNNTFKAVSSIPLPNTLDVANRASREYVPDMKGDNIQQRLSNVIRNKLWMTDGLPITRNLWGEKILQTPKGSEGWLYQMFNVVKLQELQDKPESKLIYDLYTRTENPDVVPSVPMRKLTVKGEKMELTAKQYERYAELVGKERKRLLQQRMKEKGFAKLNDEQKIKTLKRTWDKGQEEGRSMFLQEQE